MRTKVFLVAFLLMFAAGSKCEAQKVSVSTNLIDWAYLWTINGELGFSVDQHFSLSAGKYIPRPIADTSVCGCLTII